MIKGKELFQHIHNQVGHYNTRQHITKMMALLSRPPPEVIQRYQYMQEYSWLKPIRQEDSRVCKTAEEYFCGPFFDKKGITRFSISNRCSGSQIIIGCFLYKNLIPDRNLSNTVSFLGGEEKEMFLDLTKGMLVWHPDARKSAGKLARHPFLQPKQTSA